MEPETHELEVEGTQIQDQGNAKIMLLNIQNTKKYKSKRFNAKYQKAQFKMLGWEGHEPRTTQCKDAKFNRKGQKYTEIQQC